MSPDGLDHRIWMVAINSNTKKHGFFKGISEEAINITHQWNYEHTEYWNGVLSGVNRHFAQTI